MFTGIVKGLGTVVSGQVMPGLARFSVELPAGYGDGLARGASVAVDGTCLTATDIEGDRATFDVMRETLERTTLGTLAVGSRVNVERSYRVGDEVGGHVVSGHVSGTADILSVDTPEHNRVITFRVPTEWMKYILPKGFVALDGCSLTVVDADRAAGAFRVWLIPETLARTTFGFKVPGDKVNFEIDSRTQAIVDTVKAVLRERTVS